MIKPLLRFISLLNLTVLAACSPAPEPAASLEVAARTVHAGALSPDSTHAVIGSANHGGSLWSLADGERLYNWNHQAGELTLIQQAAFSPDGGWAATSDGVALVLWQVADGKPQGYWHMTSDIRALALGRYGNVAALAFGDGRAALYDVRAGRVLQSVSHAGPVNDVAVSDNLARLVSAGDDNRVRVWDSNTGEMISETVFADPVQRVAMTADGERILASARYDSSDILNASTGELIWRLPLGRERVLRGQTLSTARFSGDGDYLLTGRPDGRVQLWDINAEVQIYQWQLPKRKGWQPAATIVMAVGFSESPNRYYAISSDGFVHTLRY